MGKYKLTWKDLTLRDFKIYLFALFKAFIPKKKIKSLNEILSNEDLIPNINELSDPIAWAARTSLPPI